MSTDALLDIRGAPPNPFRSADGGELLVLDGVDLNCAGPDRRASRPHRVRQIHFAALIAGLMQASAGTITLSRPAGRRARARHRHGVPGLRVVSLVDGAGKRAARPRGARASRSRRSGSARWRRSTSSASTAMNPPIRANFRRHAPARRLCPRAGRASEHPSDGRAVLRARRADRGDAAHRFPRIVGRRQAADQGRHPGDAQYRGSGADVRPHPAVLFQSGPDHPRDHGRPANSPAIASIRNSAIWSRRSMWR